MATLSSKRVNLGAKMGGFVSEKWGILGQFGAKNGDFRTKNVDLGTKTAIFCNKKWRFWLKMAIFVK